jgi:hypothetical protein
MKLIQVMYYKTRQQSLESKAVHKLILNNQQSLWNRRMQIQELAYPVSRKAW